MKVIIKIKKTGHDANSGTNYRQMNEFTLIDKFFAQQKEKSRDDVALGIGDDCAILSMPLDHQLIVSIDTLVSGVHFPVTTCPYDIGYKALAVNLSDLAAMGATPAWFTLALTIPAMDEPWLSEFSDGLFHLAEQFNVQLIGGDTTRGPLSITIQVHGFTPVGKAVTRKDAKPGDLIYVTHTLGEAGLALQHIQGQVQLSSSVFESMLIQLNRPFPRIKEGLLLRLYATAMIDLSDGLLADIGHILKQSQVGALIEVDKLPVAEDLKRSLDSTAALKLALTAGDDYELCFTIPAQKKEEVEQLMHAELCPITCIGQITSTGQLELMHGNQPIAIGSMQGYSHF